MAGEEQYINPIIHSMIETSRQGQAKAQLAEQIRASKEQEKLKSHQLDLEANRLENEHQYHQDTLKNANALLQAHLAQAKNESIKQVAEHIRQGGNPEAYRQPLLSLPDLGTAIPATPQGQVNIPLVGNRPISSFETPAQEAARIRGLSGAKAGGAREAEIPFEKQLIEYGAKLKSEATEQAQKFESSQKDKEIASHEKIAKMAKDTQLLVNGATNATHLQVAHLEYDIPPDQLRTGVVLGLTGQRAFNSDNRYDRAVQNAIQANGGRVITPKDADQLKQMKVLDTTFDRLNEFANQYLPDEKKSGAGIKAYLGGKLLKTELPTDAKNKLDEIKTGALNAGRALEGITSGRVTNLQLELVLNGMGAGGYTKQQAVDKIKNLQEMYINKEQNLLLGGIPDAQKKLIYKTYDITPSWLKFAPPKNTAGHVLDKDKSLEIGQPIYKD